MHIELHLQNTRTCSTGSGCGKDATRVSDPRDQTVLSLNKPERLEGLVADPQKLPQRHCRSSCGLSSQHREAGCRLCCSRSAMEGRIDISLTERMWYNAPTVFLSALGRSHPENCGRSHAPCLETPDIQIPNLWAPESQLIH